MSTREIGYNAEALRAIVRAILTEKDGYAVTILLALQGFNGQKTADTLAEIGCEGGAVDTLAKKLADKADAHDFCRDLARRFAPFVGLLRDVLPRGVWRFKAGRYQLLTFEEASRNLHEKREEVKAREKRKAERAAREKWLAEERARVSARKAELAERKAVRLAIPYKKAAKRLHIKLDMVRHYVVIGYLVPVHVRGLKLAVGVTRESVKTCKLYLDGYRFTAGGVVVEPGAWVGRGEVCRIVNRAISSVNIYANEGRIVRVYNRPDGTGEQCCGYTRESAEALASDLAAGVYFTRGGKIIGTERVSLYEARTITGRGIKFVLKLAKAGKLEHVYADSGLKHPVGYTRASVVAVAHEYPPDVRARAAVAVPGFMIAELPPPPRPPRLIAAKLSPAEPEAPKRQAATPTLAPPKRKPSPFVFRLIDTPKKEPQTMNTPGTETEVPKAAEASADDNGQKLQTAKAFVIHEAGVIRAICVSEDDRDEIAAALKFYRKCKGRESEIESALAFMDMAKATLGIKPQANAEAEHQTGEGDANGTGAKA